jgi:hypothetical protein
MSYSTSGLNLLVGGLTGEAISLWTYKSTDNAAAVDASGYISDAKARGLKVGDIVWVQDTDDAALLTSSHVVVTVNATTGVADLSNGVTIGGGSNSD